MFSRSVFFCWRLNLVLELKFNDNHIYKVLKSSEFCNILLPNLVENFFPAMKADISEILASKTHKFLNQSIYCR